MIRPLAVLPPAASAPCPRCETIADFPVGAGHLYLWFPLGHSLGKALGVLRARGVPYERLAGEQGVRAAVAAGDLAPLTATLATALGAEELADSRALFAVDRATPTLEAFARVTSLARLAGEAGAGWLRELLRERRVTARFQPIVHVAEPGRVFAHEALLRGIAADGALIGAGTILRAARGAGLLFQLDLLARRTAIRVAAERGITGALFINFNPTAIYDPAFCLRSTVAAVDAAGLARDAIVFEVTEADQPSDLAHLRRILTFYRDAGFRVALDDFGAGFSSLNLLHELRPDFLKLDMALLRNVHRDPYKALIAAKILEVTQGLGIRTVAEGIELAEEFDWARAHGADFAQGYLFGHPE